MAKFDLGDFGSNLLTQGSGALISGAISSLFGDRAQKRATEASLGLMREQQMMQRQNNLEAATLMRQSKERAGFNVNADGSISPSLTPPSAGQTAVSTDIGSVKIPTQAEQDLTRAKQYEASMQGQIQEAQLPGIDEEQRSRIAKNWADSTFSTVQAENLPYVYSVQINEICARIDNLYKQNEKIDKEIEKYDSDIDVNEANKSLLQQKENESKETVLQIQQEIAKIRATIDNINANTKLQEAEKKKAEADAQDSSERSLWTRYQRKNIYKLWNAEIRKNKSLQNLNEAQRRKVLFDAMLLAKENNWYAYGKALEVYGVSANVASTIAKYAK